MENSQWMANIVSGEKSILSDYSFEDLSLQDDVDPLYAILQEVDEDISTDHLCSINLIRESLKQYQKMHGNYCFRYMERKSRSLPMHENCWKHN